MTVTVRFAPSPTGLIHIGNARTALFNWLFAQKHKGRFVQRFDDTDAARSKPEYADAILYDLHWLGIFPDAVEHQSARTGRYDEAVERLKGAGLLYPCYETAEELELKRKIRLSREAPSGLWPRGTEADRGRQGRAGGGGPPAALALPAAQFRRRSDGARARRGPLAGHRARRRNGRPRLPLRPGAGAGGRQLPLHAAFGRGRHRHGHHPCHPWRRPCHQHRRADRSFNALGATPPAFGHHNLLTTASGEGLSKRSGALSIAGLREAGIEPMAVASLAVLIGTSESVAACPNLAALADRFDPAATSKSRLEVRSGGIQCAQPRADPPDAVRRGPGLAFLRRASTATRPNPSGARFAATWRPSPRRAMVEDRARRPRRGRGAGGRGPRFRPPRIRAAARGSLGISDLDATGRIS